MKRLCTISIRPADTKNDDFCMALAEYFTKEFKINGLVAHNKKTYVDISLSNQYQDKYNSVIIDCLNGKMYLRGQNCNDKYFGRLSKFITNRASDAYNCVNYNATRIINRINKLESEMQNKDLTNEELDQVIDDVIVREAKKRLKVREPICQMPDYGIES